MRRRNLYIETEILFESVMGYGHPHARGVWMYSCESCNEKRQRRRRARDLRVCVTTVSHRPPRRTDHANLNERHTVCAFRGHLKFFTGM